MTAGERTPVPLSWQQRYGLRSELGSSQPGSSLVAVVPVDPTLSDQELDQLVQQAEAGLEALRLRIDSAESGHVRAATEAGQLRVAERRRFSSRVAASDDIKAVWRELSFSHTDGPLCRVLAYDLVDAEDALTDRWLAWFFDHLISDMVSVELFKEAFEQQPKGFDELAGYVEWLQQQASGYHSLDTPEAEFWREQLRDAPLDICDRLSARIVEQAGFGPLLTRTGRALTADEDELWELCGQYEATPFMVIGCAVALAVAEATSMQDLVFVLSAHGRDEDSVQIFGYLSNLVPLRLNIPDVSQPRQALDRIHTAVADAGAHCSTPWPYINRAVGMARPDRIGDSTVTLNFVGQLPLNSEEFSQLQGRNTPGEESGLWIDILQRHEGGFYLLAKYDPTRYRTEQVEQLCDAIVAHWQSLLG
jgi:hypothetical protein